MKHPSPGWFCSSCCFLLISFCVTEIRTFSTTLTQTPVSITELVDKDIEISCSIKGENIDNLRLYWYRKSNQKGDLEFVTSAPNSLDKFSYGGNIDQSRFLIRRVNFQNLFTLKITKLNFSDNGDYFCMAEQASKWAFGDGTKLSVVETLPTTVKPTSKKPQCRCKKQNTPKLKTSGLVCSYAIWVPLAGGAVILLIGLYFLLSHTHRVYRRTHKYFRK
ncbi:T-cell surface glycoprotein CD8 beta chain [Pseudophryne corroboree]|uniref:T-cell surface glycoprotein CD8 beta chain n=1 Tax=Pseudophryne corroboree TaxID=495146 RepID=UPI0030814B6B